MTELSVADYLKYANLQMAAEAFIRNEKTLVLSGSGQDLINALKTGNNYASRFTSTEATKFASEWTALDQKVNTKTGFSGTLFKNNDTGELVLSFRSTEFIRDAIRDSQATNTLEIANTGWAWGQIADMEAWFAELNTSPDMLQGKFFSVTGYSLGGHLATAFNLLRREDGTIGNIDNVVTFNGAGVGNVKTETLRDALDYFNGLRADPGTMKARLGFSIPELAEFYDQLRTNLTNRTWDATQALAALQALTIIPVGSDDEILRLRVDVAKAPLTQALNEIIALQDQRKTIANYTAGSGPEANVQISTFLPSTPETPAETFDYRLAVILAGRRADATSLVGGALQAVLGKDIGDQLTNQWDLVGTETTGWPVLPGKKALARTCGQRHFAANEAGRRAA